MNNETAHPRVLIPMVNFKLDFGRHGVYNLTGEKVVDELLCYTHIQHISGRKAFPSAAQCV